MESRNPDIQQDTSRPNSMNYRLTLPDMFRTWIMCFSLEILMKKIGNDDCGITRGDPVISKSGFALRKCTQEYNLYIVNRLDVCDGKWTRVNTRHSNQRSILDYLISSKSLTPSITKMTIDDEAEYYRLQGKNRTDHNSIIIDINLQISITEPCPQQVWKLNKESNWHQFNSLVYKNNILKNLKSSPPGDMTSYHKKMAK